MAPTGEKLIKLGLMLGSPTKLDVNIVSTFNPIAAVATSVKNDSEQASTRTKVIISKMLLRVSSPKTHLNTKQLPTQSVGFLLQIFTQI